MAIADHFTFDDKEEPTHRWSLVEHEIDEFKLDSLAEELADAFVKDRCLACIHHYNAWKDKRDNGLDLPETSQRALRAFIKAAFGVPEAPESPPDDHIEGFAGELLWYYLTLEMSDEELVKLDVNHFSATDPGGDGLAIHRLDTGELRFRLWEIKKHTGGDHISTTVRLAYKQLKEKCTEYLARYVASAGRQPQADPELNDFYGQLMDLWIDQDESASVGVSVATSDDSLPQECFTTFGEQFPELTDPVRLLGMLKTVEDFPAFAQKVRECVWKGL